MNDKIDPIIITHVRNSKTVTAGLQSAKKTIQSMFGLEVSDSQLTNRWYRVLRPQVRPQKADEVKAVKPKPAKGVTSEMALTVILDSIKHLNDADYERLLSRLKRHEIAS